MSSNLLLDQKYAALVAQLEILNGKFDQFINGGPTVTIVTGNGTIKSLAGIVADLLAIRYMQKIIDHKLLSDAVADIDIVDGMLVRVWGDATLVNGLYKMTGGVLVKISYVDLYDLAHPPV